MLRCLHVLEENYCSSILFSNLGRQDICIWHILLSLAPLHLPGLFPSHLCVVDLMELCLVVTIIHNRKPRLLSPRFKWNQKVILSYFYSLQKHYKQMAKIIKPWRGVWCRVRVISILGLHAHRYVFLIIVYPSNRKIRNHRRSNHKPKKTCWISIRLFGYGARYF